jgi:L-ascorbate metabolism protein UlaG (beta-lactamase superfamily)
MKITKLGHCCLIIEEGKAKILTDPGDYTTAQNSIRGLTHILITHEHPDHYHVPSLNQVLANNPAARVYTNSAVGNLLVRAGINYELLQHGDKQSMHGVEVEGIGKDHHVIYPTLPIVMNTGYFFADKFFYPGDALTDPKRPVKLLGLPINAPWLTAAEAFAYAQAVKPEACFPVHDGNMLRRDVLYRLAGKVLEPVGIKFLPVEEGEVAYAI